MGEILDCGHPRPVLPAGHVSGTGVATDSQTEATQCHACALERERALLRDPNTLAFTAYVASDSQTITAWPGGELAKVVDSRRLARRLSPFGTGDVYYYLARTEDGREWYGRNPGAGAVDLPAGAS